MQTWILIQLEHEYPHQPEFLGAIQHIVTESQPFQQLCSDFSYGVLPTQTLGPSFPPWSDWFLHWKFKGGQISFLYLMTAWQGCKGHSGHEVSTWTLLLLTLFHQIENLHNFCAGTGSWTHACSNPRQRRCTLSAWQNWWHAGPSPPLLPIDSSFSLVDWPGCGAC